MTNTLRELQAKMEGDFVKMCEEIEFLRGASVDMSALVKDMKRFILQVQEEAFDAGRIQGEYEAKRDEFDSEKINEEFYKCG